MTSAEDYRPDVGVHLILTNPHGQVLLQRANTGFADGEGSGPPRPTR